MSREQIHILHGNTALDAESWQRLFHRDSSARFTQSPLWARLGMEELHWKPGCLIWPGEEAVLPFIISTERSGRSIRIESMPWGMIGGPLMDPSIKGDITGDFRKAITNLALETVLYPSRNLELPGWDAMNHIVHVVELPEDGVDTWEYAHRKCRTAARHARNKGVAIDRIRHGSYLHGVTRLHQAQQQSRNARTYSDSWWRKLLSEAEPNCGLWGAFHKGHVIAALLIAWWNDHAVALVSTGDPCSRPLKAGNLLYLSVFEYLGINGIRTVDLGGSRGKRSLEAFKESLGGKPRTRVWYRHRQRIYRIYRTMAGLLRREIAIDM